MPGMTDEQIRQAFFGGHPKSDAKHKGIDEGHGQHQYM